MENLVERLDKGWHDLMKAVKGLRQIQDHDKDEEEGEGRSDTEESDSDDEDDEAFGKREGRRMADSGPILVTGADGPMENRKTR
jgi:hypothetical protein